MVYNINKLKGKITESGYTLKTFAPAVNMCESSLRRKMNNPDAEFTISESQLVKNKLGLTTNEYIDIFFGNGLELKSK